MDKIGFIGLGSMGGALLQSLLQYGAFSQKEVLVSTRTKEKIKGFIVRFPEVTIMDSNIELAKESRTIFIFTQQECEEMVLITFLGTAKLLQKNKMGFDELITRVATKGGISEEGLKVLNEQLPFVFDELFEATLNKHQLVKSSMDKMYI